MTKKLPTISAETLAKHNGCTACAYLQGLSQCNACRANRPNRQTTKRAECMSIWRDLIAQGWDRAEAGREAELRVFGVVGGGPVIGG